MDKDIAVVGAGSMGLDEDLIRRAKKIAVNGSMSLKLIATHRRRGKRKAKNWDSPYPS